MALWPHQKKALEGDNNAALWCWECGTGKSYAAVHWLKQKDRMRNPVVLCPKQIKKKWQDMVPHATIMTPYEVRTLPLPSKPSAIVVDEADEYASPLFIAKKRSAMAEKLYTYIKNNPEVHVLLLTATPIRSHCANLHTLLTYIGRYQDWATYRSKYMYLETPRWSTRPTWMHLSNWQILIQSELERNADIALMKDMVAHLPPEEHVIHKLKEPKYEKNTEWEASKQFVEDHRLEQCGKDKLVQEIARGFRKVVVVAHYRNQIDDLRSKLSNKRQTFVLDGRTKDVESVIKDAEAAGECYFIVQAAVGAGFEIPSFSCMIFASQGYSVRNFVQMKARIRRINALKPVVYHYLQAGRCDRAVYNSIQAGRDFIPSEYLM